MTHSNKTRAWALQYKVGDETGLGHITFETRDDAIEAFNTPGHFGEKIVPAALTEMELDYTTARKRGLVKAVKVELTAV